MADERRDHSKTWLVILVIAAIFAAPLLLVPSLNDGSYTCGRLPIQVIVHPYRQTSGRYFFDQGRQCNSDARTQGGIGGGVFAVGVVVAIGCEPVNRMVQARRARIAATVGS